MYTRLTSDSGRCAACGGGPLVVRERIARSELAAAWRREDEAVGADQIAQQRYETLLAILPLEIQFDGCPACGLQMASPRVVWSASTYPSDQSYPVRWEFERAADDLGPAPLDVLELGCGTGNFLALVAGRGHRPVGLDFSASAVAQAQARGLTAFCGGIEDLERHLGRHARFDAVVLFHLIEHLADPGALLGALAPLLRPGARIFLSCPGPRRFTKLIREQQAGASDFWDYPPQHVARWTLPALRALLEASGWRVTVATEEPFSWTAAASQIGVARAIYRGRLNHQLTRRAYIAAAWLRLALEPRRRCGVSLYAAAVRETTVA
jgi:SAM-dependent methyltransferase